jgi:hypothetical protein
MEPACNLKPHVHIKPFFKISTERCAFLRTYMKHREVAYGVGRMNVVSDIMGKNKTREVLCTDG